MVDHTLYYVDDGGVDDDDGGVWGVGVCVWVCVCVWGGV